MFQFRMMTDQLYIGVNTENVTPTNRNLQKIYEHEDQ